MKGWLVSGAACMFSLFGLPLTGANTVDRCWDDPCHYYEVIKSCVGHLGLGQCAITWAAPVTPQDKIAAFGCSASETDGFSGKLTGIAKDQGYEFVVRVKWHCNAVAGIWGLNDPVVDEKNLIGPTHYLAGDATQPAEGSGGEGAGTDVAGQWEVILSIYV